MDKDEEKSEDLKDVGESISLRHILPKPTKCHEGGSKKTETNHQRELWLFMQRQKER